jgi:DNA-binding transcriptional LysR family regulator
MFLIISIEKNDRKVSMELRQLTTFRMVAHTLSFSRAATALNYVQSSVTAQIQALEEDLGVQLFDRMGKRVSLTDAGKRLLTYAEKMLMMAEEARSAVRVEEEPTGTVVFSAPESLCTYRLPAILRNFHDRFPRARLILRPYPCDRARRSVADGEIDIAFTLDEPIRSTALVGETLVRERLLLLAPPDSPLARLPIVRTDDLLNEHFLLTEQTCTYRHLFERALREEGIDAITDLEFTNVEAIKQCAIAGMGIAFLPEFTVAAELEQGRLVSLTWEGHAFEVMIQMLWHKEKWFSPAMSAFINITRESFQEEERAVLSA